MERRTENKETYLNEDGTYTDIIHAGNIRYEDENGELIDIDNSIIEVENDAQLSRSEKQKIISEGHKYKNASAQTDIFFSDRIEGSNAIQINQDKYKFSFSLDVDDQYVKDAKKYEEIKETLQSLETSERLQETASLQTTSDEKEVVSNSNEEPEKENSSINQVDVVSTDDKALPAIDEAKAELTRDIQDVEKFERIEDFSRVEQLEADDVEENKNYSILYPNAIEAGIDMRFHSSDTGIKEEIIFYEKPDFNEVEYDINVENMTPEITDNGTIVFHDNETGEEAASMQKPYMYDSTEEMERHQELPIR